LIEVNERRVVIFEAKRSKLLLEVRLGVFRSKSFSLLLCKC